MSSCPWMTFAASLISAFVVAAASLAAQYVAYKRSRSELDARIAHEESILTIKLREERKRREVERGCEAIREFQACAAELSSIVIMLAAEMSISDSSPNDLFENWIRELRPVYVRLETALPFVPSPLHSEAKAVLRETGEWIIQMANAIKGRRLLTKEHKPADKARSDFAMSSSQWIEAQDNVSLL